MSTPVLSLAGVGMRFTRGSRSVEALSGIDLEVASGELVVLRGSSGSGKTTLLLVAGTMQRPTSGRVLVAGQEPYAMSPGPRAAFRAEHVGFVFQTFHLVPYLHVTANVMLARPGIDHDASAVAGMLARVGLADRTEHLPGELSAGERQRVALARALLARPSVILADEPTGNLDPENAAIVLDLLAEFHAAGGTVLLATHGTAADARATRVVQLTSGRLVAGATA